MSFIGPFLMLLGVVLVGIAFAAHLVSIGAPFVVEIPGGYAVRTIGFLGFHKQVACYLTEEEAWRCVSRILEDRE